MCVFCCPKSKSSPGGGVVVLVLRCCTFRKVDDDTSTTTLDDGVCVCVCVCVCACVCRTCRELLTHGVDSFSASEWNKRTTTTMPPRRRREAAAVEAEESDSEEASGSGSVTASDRESSGEDDGSESDEGGSGSESSSEGFDDDEFVMDEDEEEEEEGDDSDGEGASTDDDEDDDDDENDDEEETLARPVSSHMMGMSRAFQSLVGDDEDEDAAATASEMLPKSRKQYTDELEAKADEKKRRAIKKAKIELKERGHVKPKPRGRDIESDMMERRLHNTATKGVVRLFNAVGKAQRDAEKAKKMRRKDALISKTQFLEELRGGEKNKSSEATEKSSKASFLNDDFMLGSGKMKDWDKEQEVAPKDLEYDEEEDDVF